MVSGNCPNSKTDDSKDAIRLFRYILVEKMSDISKLKVVEDILNDVINAALFEAELGTSAENHEGNKFTTIVVQNWDQDNCNPVECQNTFVGVRNEEQKSSLSAAKPKKKKKLSFSSIFSFSKKNQKSEEDGEDYDKFSHTLPNFQPLSKSRKFSSAVELRSDTKSEKPSILKRSSNFLRRSLSFRDVRKKDKTISIREVVGEKKVLEWRQSLQSLVENDFSVSYNDLSFINYDALNEFNYKESVQLKPGRSEMNFVGRTQSLREKVSLTYFILFLQGGIQLIPLYIENTNIQF